MAPRAGTGGCVVKDDTFDDPDDGLNLARGVRSMAVIYAVAGVVWALVRWL